MRRLVYSRLNSDSTLSNIVVGGWHQPNAVHSENQPRKPFGIIRVSEMADETCPDMDSQLVTVEVSIYDRVRKDSSGNMIASYLDIDSAIERIYTLLNRHQLSGTSYGWGITKLLFDTVSEDLVDDGWNCIFKYIRFNYKIVRGR